MKGVIKLSVLALICTFTITAFAGAVVATGDAVVAQVITTTSSNSETKVTQFAPHQLIFVKYVIQSDKTADIKVVDAHNNEVSGTAHLEVSGSGEFSFTLAQPGNYYVLVNGEPWYPIAVASFFVLPEVLGAISALGAGIAAFGILKFKNKTLKI